MRYTRGVGLQCKDTIATIHNKVAASIAASLNGLAEVNDAYEFSASGATIKASKKEGTTADLSFEYRKSSDGVFVNTSFKLDITDATTNSLTLKYYNPSANPPTIASQAIGVNSSAAVYKATLDVVFGQLAAGLGYAQVATVNDDLMVTLNDAISAVPFWFEGTNIDETVGRKHRLDIGRQWHRCWVGRHAQDGQVLHRTFTEVTTTTNGILPGSNARVIKVGPLCSRQHLGRVGHRKDPLRHGRQRTPLHRSGRSPAHQEQPRFGVEDRRCR